nr:two-component regulator propeller domain-containing protein [Bacteroidia bacterium]
MALSRFVVATVFFILSCGSFIFGQEPFFKQMQVSSSASGLKVNAICQDSKKIIWLGTSEGLFQFDGFVFKNVELPSNLKNEVVVSVAAFPTEGVLAGTRSGKIFSVIQDQVDIITFGKTIISSPISDICLISKSEIWIATMGEGLFRFNKNRWEQFTKKDGLGDDYIYSIICDSSGHVWAGSDGGLSFSRIQDGKMGFRNLDASDGLPDNIVRKLVHGPGNTIGIGMEEKGFCLYAPNQSTFSYPDVFKSWNKGPAISIMMLENEFWIGTSKYGIIDYEFKGDKRTRQFAKNEGFDGLNVSCMLKDNEGNVWIGANNELYFTPGERIEFKKTLDGFPLNNIRTILTDHDENIWFSNDTALFKYDKIGSEGAKLTQPLKNTKFTSVGIISMYEDIYGFLWMGTFDHGVLRYDPANGNIKVFSENNGLVNSSVLSIAGDGSTIWFATLGGVSKCYLIDSTLGGATAFVSFTEESGLGNNFIYKVYIDNLKRVWFATDGKGITCYNDGKFTNYSENEGLKSKIIYSLTQDHSGNIWLSSSADGLYRFDGKSFRNFTTAQGLSDMNITSLATDRRGNILVVNKKGIDVIDPDNFQIVYFGSEFGVSKIDPDVNVISNDDRGNTWIGTQKGIIKLSLEQKVGEKKPILILNKVQCFLENVDTTKIHEFDFDKNHISFDYTAIWYSDPQKISYQYKLTGYNNEWITT